jgi:hypothetical protein
MIIEATRGYSNEDMRQKNNPSYAQYARGRKTFRVVTEKKSLAD